MAVFPCDICHRRYSGKANTIYVGWMAGGYNDRRKWNACSVHVAELQEKIRANFTLVEVGGVLQTEDTLISIMCEKCGLEPTQQTWFAHTYVRSEDPAVYARGLCNKCAGPIAQTFSLAA